MRYFLLFFLLFSTIGDGLKKSSRINNGVQQARQLYQQKKYQEAANLYRFLTDSLHVNDGELLLNLAHATYQNGNKNLAQKYYLRLRNNLNPAIQGAALNQLGVLYFRNDNPEKAIYYFKKAIVQNPQNNIARYNYELVQKFTAANPIRNTNRKSKNKKQADSKTENKPQNAQSPASSGRTDLQPDLNNPITEPLRNKPQASPSPGSQSPQEKVSPNNNNKVNKGPAGGQEKGLDEEKNNANPANIGQAGNEALQEKEKQMQTLRQRLSKTDLTPEKASMLLEAMRQAELQYLQQLPRPPARRPDKNKPDW